MICPDCEQEVIVETIETAFCRWSTNEDGEVDWCNCIGDPEFIDVLNEYCRCGCGKSVDCPYIYENEKVVRRE